MKTKTNSLFTWIRTYVRKLIKWLNQKPSTPTLPTTPEEPIEEPPVEPELPPQGPITTGQDPDEGTPSWYRLMFKYCKVNAGKETQLNRTIDAIQKGMPRYRDTIKRLGINGPRAEMMAYILGAIHFKEASCNFAGVLHNGEKIIGTGKLTKLVPKGRGPFISWEEAAIDALTLNGSRWKKIVEGSTDIGDILEAVEKFNGLGYIRGPGRAETSPYLWACSNINDGFGKYVRDGVYDPKASTGATVGAALILRELYSRGLFKCTGVAS